MNSAPNPQGRAPASGAWRAPALLLAVALAVRLGYVALQVNWQVFKVALMAPDAERYLALARNLLEKGIFSLGGQTPTAADMPGYPLFLAGFLALFGENYTLLYVVQALISTATVWLMYVAGKGAWNRRTGLLAGWFAALYPLGFFFVASPLSETLYVVACVGFLAVYVSFGQSPGGALAAGLAGGAAALIRPLLGGFAGLLGIWLLVRPGRRLQGVLLLLGLVMALAPWTIRNAATFGEFIPLSSRGGFEFYLGNAPDATGGTDGHLIWGTDVKVPPAAPVGMSESQWASDLAGRAIKGALDDPGHLLGILPNKFWNMWRPTWGGASVRNWLFLGGGYLVLVGLSLYGLLREESRAGGGLFWGYVLYHVLAHLAVFGIIRYRIPVSPAFCLLAAGGLAAGLGWLGSEGKARS